MWLSAERSRIPIEAAAVIWRFLGCFGARSELRLTGASIHLRVAVTRSRSLNEIRTVDPCGQRWTQAGSFRAGQAQVALAGQLHGLPVRALLVALDHGDVAPRAALGAVGAADAGGLVDRHSRVPTWRLMAPVGQSIMQTGSAHW